jgi:hypothetical protein
MIGRPWPHHREELYPAEVWDFPGRFHTDHVGAPVDSVYRHGDGEGSPDEHDER